MHALKIVRNEKMYYTVTPVFFCLICPLKVRFPGVLIILPNSDCMICFVINRRLAHKRAGRTWGHPTSADAQQKSANRAASPQCITAMGWSIQKLTGYANIQACGRHAKRHSQQQSAARVASPNCISAMTRSIQKLGRWQRKHSGYAFAFAVGRLDILWLVKPLLR